MGISKIDIEQFRNGERESFDLVYRGYFRPLIYFARSYLQGEELAEEVVNDSMVKLWQYRLRITNPAQIKAFLYITTKNACIDALRSQRARPCPEAGFRPDPEAPYDLSQLASEEPTAYHRILYVELLQQIEKAVSTLPRSQQLVFRKAVLEGKTTDEIAAETGMSVASIFTQKSKAVTTLRKLLTDNLFFLFFW